MQAFLEDSLLYLKSLELENLTQSYVDWLNNPIVCQYNSHYRFPNTWIKTKEYIDRIMNSNETIVLAIYTKTANKHIGNISLQSINLLDSNAEFAILIGDIDEHSQGIGYKAAKLLINHGFNSLNLHRIYCATSIENIPMQKLAKKLSFQEEGISKAALFKNGHYVDIIHYGLLNPCHKK